MPRAPAPPSTTSGAEPGRDHILLISLDFQNVFGEIFGDFLVELFARGDVYWARTAATAMRLLVEEPRPDVVVVTDTGLTQEHNLHVWDAVLAVIRQGGTGIIMGQFPANARPSEARGFFLRAGLPWELGPRHRAVLVLNGEAESKIRHQDMLPNYFGYDAVCLKNVANRDAVYVECQDGGVEPVALEGSEAEWSRESPIVLTNLGEGRLGYIGDVDMRHESVVLAIALGSFSACDWWKLSGSG
ncbi:hypothetical protein CDD83_3788 [Cordyceps sp. RAO-2017]|nr:hypothetical protein CDD83_3788 [Cordyceps sp. RAO-2017]